MSLLDDDSTRSIAALYAELTGYIDEAWGRAHQTWVFGEIQKLSDHRSGHLYVDLVDPTATGRDAPTLKAKCWRSTWGPMKTAVRDAGLALTEGSVVRVRGYVDIYAPRGELGFIITALDLEALRLATLGEHARRRAALIKALTDEGLLEANRAHAIPEVPLRVGLVASPGTEGYSDFLGMLEASGFSFHVVLARAAVQGQTAPAEVAAAIAALAHRECDVICVVRGGGSQADLAAFDDEMVARAIASCPVPVCTGIGHTGDVSVADLVSASASRTPTACAESLAAIVRAWYAEHVAGSAGRIEDAVLGVLDERGDTVDQARRHLVVVGRHRLHRVDDALAARGARVARTAPRALDHAAARVALAARRPGPLCAQHVAGAADALAARRALLAAYDPRRLLERGWSITTDEAGTVLRSVAGVEVGATLVTRLADGVARSTVRDVDVA